MENVEQTIISQYANSATIVQLIQSMNGYIDPATNFKAFYDYVWNVETAQGFGLDIIGRIVNISRQLSIPSNTDYFGFNEGVDYYPFDEQPFYDGTSQSDVYTLSDDAYRTLILMKALLNISDSSAPAINRLLQNLFVGRGRCYVTDIGDMRIRFVFEFALLPYELAILTRSNAVPRPAAVLAEVMQIDLDTTFGFSESGDSQPFDYGVFYNPAFSIVPAN